jgi:hypothetical protein
MRRRELSTFFLADLPGIGEGQRADLRQHLVDPRTFPSSFAWAVVCTAGGRSEQSAVSVEGRATPAKRDRAPLRAPRSRRGRSPLCVGLMSIESNARLTTSRAHWLG